MPVPRLSLIRVARAGAIALVALVGVTPAVGIAAGPRIDVVAPTGVPSLPTPDEPAPDTTEASGDLGAPVPDDTATDEVVHSWALAPAGSPNPDEAGNRPFLSYVADPGTAVEDGIVLYNYSNVQLTFRLYATDAFNNESGQFDLLAGDEQSSDVGTWVTMPQEFITVPAESQVQLPLTVQVPPDALAGDHTGAIVAATSAVGVGEDGQAVTVERRTGTRLYVRVNGPLHAELVIESVETDYQPSINPLGGTAVVTYGIRNRGNVRLAGTHSVSVAGPFGWARARVAAQPFNDLLPGESITITARLDDVPAIGAAFTTVTVEPTGGVATEVGVQSRNATTFAPPITLLLVIALAVLGRRAWTRYRRHRLGDAAPGPTGSDGDDDAEPEIDSSPLPVPVGSGR